MKLIKQYQKKIETLDLHIESCTCLIREKRSAEMSTEEYYNATEELRLEREKSHVKRQCYIQFIADLEFRITV